MADMTNREARKWLKQLRDILDGSTFPRPEYAEAITVALLALKRQERISGTVEALELLWEQRNAEG